MTRKSDAIWKDLNDAYYAFQDKLIEYRVASTEEEVSFYEDRGDAWHIGYFLGGQEWTTDSDEALRDIKEGFAKGVKARKLQDFLKEDGEKEND